MAVRMAVVGTGYIGRRHCEIIRQHTETTLVAVADSDPQAMSGLSVPQCSSLETLLTEHGNCEVISLCTPNYLHTVQAIQVLNSGKHVIIEKPMGLCADACRQVGNLAAAGNKQVFVVMQNRFTPTAKWLKNLLEEGRLGKLLMVQVNCLWNRDDRYYANSDWKGHAQHDGGVLFTQFSHFIDILYWLLGDIGEIQGQMANLSHRHSTDMMDSGNLIFHFLEHEALGSLHFSTGVWQQNFESSITLIGTRGSVRVAGQYMNEVSHCNIQDYTLPDLPAAAPPNHYGSYQGSAANHHYIIQNVVDTLAGKSTPSIGAQEGAAVVDIIQRMYRACGTPA